MAVHGGMAQVVMNIAPKNVLDVDQIGGPLLQGHGAMNPVFASPRIEDDECLVQKLAL